MKVMERVLAFSKGLGCNSTVFASVEDAEAFLQLAGENTILKHFHLTMYMVGQKAVIKVSKEKPMDWSELSSYKVTKRGVVLT